MLLNNSVLFIYSVSALGQAKNKNSQGLGLTIAVINWVLHESTDFVFQTQLSDFPFPCFPAGSDINNWHLLDANHVPVTVSSTTQTLPHWSIWPFRPGDCLPAHLCCDVFFSTYKCLSLFQKDLEDLIQIEVLSSFLMGGDSVLLLWTHSNKAKLSPTKTEVTGKGHQMGDESYLTTPCLQDDFFCIPKTSTLIPNISI